jgi:Ion channel
MIAAAVLGLVLTGLCVTFHYEALRLLNDLLSRATSIADRAKVLAAIIGTMLSHMTQIVLFATAYYLLRDKFGLGAFGGQFHDSFSSFLYFSTETYTSLGFGDIYPIGQLRLVTGVETLIGLVMIGWSASFTYLEMQRYWK